MYNSNRLPGQSGKFSKPFGGLVASQIAVLDGATVLKGINARSRNDKPLFLGLGISDRALYACKMLLHPGRAICDTLAPRKGLKLTRAAHIGALSTTLAAGLGSLNGIPLTICNTIVYNAPYAYAKTEAHHKT